MQTPTPRRNLRVPPPEPPKPKKKKRFPLWTFLVIILCLVLLGAAWVYADSQIKHYDSFTQMRSTVAANVFYGPVYIDDILLTGMTMEEAREALESRTKSQAESFEVILTHGDSRWRISSDEVPMTWTTESLLQKAWMIGRMGSLEQRYQQVQGLTEPVHLYSEFNYDKSAVRKLTDMLAQRLDVAPVDAAVIAFDVSNRTFTFTEAQAGQTVDAGALFTQVIDVLDRGEYGATIPVHVQEVAPTLTRADLERDYTRIASYTTKTTSDSNRNTNIQLSAHALNGQVIEPGGTISFNETTGQRTKEKGYLEAGAIENGRTVQETGGGICQTSSTLFNALVRANCEIVSRKPHAWPSDYVPRGEDATVDWPNLDLVMRNPTDTAMYIAAWYEDQTVTVEVYGITLGDGVTIELSSETTYTKAPTETIYTYNGNLAVGTQQLLRKPRTGYSVQTYKIWLKDGVEIAREELYKSEYRMINEEYEYNDGKGPPS